MKGFLVQEKVLTLTIALVSTTFLSSGYIANQIKSSSPLAIINSSQEAHRTIEHTSLDKFFGLDSNLSTTVFVHRKIGVKPDHLTIRKRNHIKGSKVEDGGVLNSNTSQPKGAGIPKNNHTIQNYTNEKSRPLVSKNITSVPSSEPTVPSLPITLVTVNKTNAWIQPSNSPSMLQRKNESIMFNSTSSPSSSIINLSMNNWSQPSSSPSKLSEVSLPRRYSNFPSYGTSVTPTEKVSTDAELLSTDPPSTLTSGAPSRVPSLYLHATVWDDSDQDNIFHVLIPSTLPYYISDTELNNTTNISGSYAIITTIGVTDNTTEVEIMESIFELLLKAIGKLVPFHHDEKSRKKYSFALRKITIPKLVIAFVAFVCLFWMPNRGIR